MKRMIGLVPVVLILFGVCSILSPSPSASSAPSSTKKTQLTVTAQAAALLTTTPGTPTPDVDLSSILVSSGDDTADIAHARNSAAQAAENLLTYDYRHPNQYVDRLAPFSTDTMLSKVTLLSTAKVNQDAQLTETGFVISATLTISPDHKSATALVLVMVNVARRAPTVDVLPTTEPTLSADDPRLVHGQYYAATPGAATPSPASSSTQTPLPTATTNPCSGYQCYQARVTVTVTLTVVNNHWLVDDFSER